MSYISLTIARRNCAAPLPKTTVCELPAGATFHAHDTQFSYCRYFRATGARQHTPHLAASQAPCPNGTCARMHFARCPFDIDQYPKVSSGDSMNTIVKIGVASALAFSYA